ncbi:MAG: hypothetical protein IPK60_03725 [Sandaracinaceae bacterium]|nr:hypothetical protein [Sandaracinaceae bacterium]
MRTPISTSGHTVTRAAVMQWLAISASLVFGAAISFGVAAVEDTTAGPLTKTVGAAFCEQPEVRPEMLGCGEITCHSNTDCPSTCGPCVAWSGTCALFQPRGF